MGSRHSSHFSPSPRSLDCRPSRAAGTAIDPSAAEAAVRQAEADWAAAAGTAGVEAWMVFYTADAIVLLPKGQLASGKELVRQSVTRLLAQSHFAVAWHPIKVEMARSGDLAFVSSAYELRFSDARGMPASDRGRRIEIWRKQADGPLEMHRRHLEFGRIRGGQRATGSAVGKRRRHFGARGHACITRAACAARVTRAARGNAAAAAADTSSGVRTIDAGARRWRRKYGDMPSDYKEAITTRTFQDHLKNPESIRYREITKPGTGIRHGSIAGSFLMHEHA